MIETSVKVDKMFKPLHDRVIILPEEAPKVSRGGIIIPDSSRESMRVRRGKFVAYGGGIHTKDKKRHELITSDGVKFGDTVLYSHEHGATQIEIGGVKHISIRDDQVMAVVEE